MYKLEVLPIAKSDIDDIIYYISHNLKNLTASKRLRDLFMNSFTNILKFPYGSAIYLASGSLKKEYRSYKVKNFIMFYTINENTKTVTVVRVLYQKMDISSILK